jgi:hypothetical protein
MSGVQAVEEIVVSPLTDLQKLADLKAKIRDFDIEIDLAEQMYGIDELRKAKDARQAEYDSLMKQVAAKVQFSEDKFLASLKRKADSYREGNLKLVRSIRTTRTIITEKFVEKFPDLALKICTIPVTKAEALVGKKNLEAYCTHATTYSYELQDLEEMRQ